MALLTVFMFIRLVGELEAWRPRFGIVYSVHVSQTVVEEGELEAWRPRFGIVNSFSDCGRRGSWRPGGQDLALLTVSCFSDCCRRGGAGGQDLALLTVYMFLRLL